MEKHMKTYRAHRALAILYAIVIVGVIAAIAVGVSGDNAKNGHVPAAVFLALGFLVAIFCLHWFVGGAAKRKKPWARVASIVIGIVALVGFPVGTLIGIYLLMNAVPEWGPPPEAPPEVS